MTDTRGIDRSSIRPDLVEHLRNPRAVTILCSRWGSAPEPSSQELLAHVRDTEADLALFSRVMILVLARSGEALSMRHDDGSAAANEWEGYEIKLGHVQDALNRAELDGVSRFAFDAATDDAGELTAFLIDRIRALRAEQAAAALAAAGAVDQMLANLKEAQAIAALEAINVELHTFADRHESPPTKPPKPVQHRLLQAVRGLHARTVWAATRRNGKFWNFDAYQHLGDGAAANAKQLCGAPIAGLREILENKVVNREFASARSFLKELLADVSKWESDYVNAARHHAVATYESELVAATNVWNDCENHYGQGGGFRDDVASKLETWFDDNDELRQKLDRQLRKAWRTTIIEPLRAAAGGIAAKTSVTD
jgi:hypothetical protein